MNDEKVISANFRLGENKISDILHSQEMNAIRSQMSLGQTPAQCRVCERSEEMTASSKRLDENQRWGDKFFSAPKLLYLDLRFGNTCNLACVSCSTRDSSGWETKARDLVQILENPVLKNYMSHTHQLSKPTKDISWYRRDSAFWKDLVSHIPDLQSIYFAGGEPLMQKEHLEFLEEIILQGYASAIELRYSTNATIVSDVMIEKWKNFKAVNIAVSVDSFEDKNDYVRYGSQWSNLIANIEKIVNAPHLKMTCTKTIHNYNIFYISDFIEKVEDLKLFDVQRIDFNLLYSPRFLSIQALPDTVKDCVKLKLQKWKGYSRFSSRIDKVLAFMNAADTSDFFHEFIQFSEALDKMRGTSFKKTFPEWSGILDEI